ncbi:MAG: hypothetical protein F6K00_29635 [Leptolyngbya sp. SIOISBB]|nr:hypothetical protein [Leptolyngbya sp. SIOISBB]
MASSTLTPPQPSWQLAREAAPSALLTQVAADNLHPDVTVDAGQMSVLKLQQAGQAQPLYLIDARLVDSETQPLCGVAGCALFGYIREQSGFRQVLKAYLNPHLPQGQTLLQPTGDLHQGLPTLVALQLVETDLQQITLAFDGQTYAVDRLDYLPHE